MTARCGCTVSTPRPGNTRRQRHFTAVARASFDGTGKGIFRRAFLFPSQVLRRLAAPDTPRSGAFATMLLRAIFKIFERMFYFWADGRHAKTDESCCCSFRFTLRPQSFTRDMPFRHKRRQFLFTSRSSRNPMVRKVVLTPGWSQTSLENFLPDMAVVISKRERDIVGSARRMVGKGGGGRG